MSEERIKTSGPWTEKDIGRIEKIVTAEGTYYEDRIVQVFCPICAASFIGPVREAGGFLGGHDLYHRWEAERAMSAESGLSA